MVIDYVIWCLVVLLVGNLVLMKILYNFLRDRIEKNSTLLDAVVKTLDVFNDKLCAVDKDVVAVKQTVDNGDEKITKEYIDSVARVSSQAIIEMFQSIDMLRKNVNDLRASYEINSGQSVCVDDIQMKDVDDGLYGSKSERRKTFAEMSFDDINIYNELNQRREEVADDETDDVENDFSVEEL